MFNFFIWVLLPLIIVGGVVFVVLSVSLSKFYHGFPKSLAAGFRWCWWECTHCGHKEGNVPPDDVLKWHHEMFEK